jgi:lipoprotein-releasing system ATP-binding protein
MRCDMSELLKIKGLSKTYHDAQRELVVLKGVDLTVAKGEAIAIVGMSGAGKSTMLHLLGGLDRPDAGSLIFQGKKLNGASRTEMDTYRNRSIGFVFQFHHLLPEFTAVENVMMPALVARRPKAEARAAAEKLLDQVGLKERLTHRPSKLSGGEQQRVALARALVNEPLLLLADEPTGNLDAKTGKRVIELIWKTTVQRDRSLVIVTHEPTIAERADRIFHLGGGQLKQIPKDELKRNMLWS